MKKISFLEHKQEALLEQILQDRPADECDLGLSKDSSGKFFTKSGVRYVPRWERDESYISELKCFPKQFFSFVIVRKPDPWHFRKGPDFGHVYAGFTDGFDTVIPIHFLPKHDVFLTGDDEGLAVLAKHARRVAGMLTQMPGDVARGSDNKNFDYACFFPISVAQFEVAMVDMKLDHACKEDIKYALSGALPIGENCTSYAVRLHHFMGVDLKKLLNLQSTREDDWLFPTRDHILPYRPSAMAYRMETEVRNNSTCVGALDAGGGQELDFHIIGDENNLSHIIIDAKNFNLAKPLDMLLQDLGEVGYSIADIYEAFHDGIPQDRWQERVAGSANQTILAAL